MYLCPIITQSEENLKKCFDKILESVQNDKVDVQDCVFSDAEILEAVLSLKAGKACSLDGITNEHVLYADVSVSRALKILFDACLIHGVVPTAFGCGVIVPLIKDKSGDWSDINNYRGITLSPIISKLFERCLVNRFEDHLLSDDLQFGFKKKNSTSHAIFVVKETINYFVGHGSTILGSALDASKAFDKVSHYGLYIKLMQRNVPWCFTRLVIFWYSLLKACVRWNQTLSVWIEVKLGVRQGGVLSPILFTVYVDDLILELKTSGYGCEINGCYCGCVFYADDILLMAASLAHLEKMLQICIHFADEWGMQFNANKSNAFVVGSKYMAYQRGVGVCLGGVKLEWADEIKYLGVWLEFGKKLEFSVKFSKMKFFNACNALLSNCSRANENVKCQLAQSYCLPILLYASDVIEFRSVDSKSLTAAWNKMYRKIFHLGYRTSVREVLAFTGSMAFDFLVDKRQMKFIGNILRHSTNETLVMFARYNTLCKKWNNLGKKYAVSCEDNSFEINNQVYKCFLKSFCE